MNDKSQIKIHDKVPNKGVDSDCTINTTNEGHQAQCPSCPWTSGIKDFKGSARILYYRHLDFVLKGK
jgi:hypothetical protein